MNDSVDENKKTFMAFSDDNWDKLADLNSRIQSHEGAWGKKGSDTDDDGVIQMPYWVSDPLISELVAFMYANNLVADFDWGSWEGGREWYKNTDEAKYEALDASTALKLLTAVIRNDRFSEGALVSAFESGDFPKIINKLVELRSA